MPLACACFAASSARSAAEAADGRRNAGHMEPARIFESALPVDVSGLGQGDGAVVAIVGHLRRTLVGAGLDVVNAHAPFAADDSRSIHAEAAQFADDSIGHRILVRQNRHESRGQS